MSKSILPIDLCTDPKRCARKKCARRCHYCLVAKYGELYWLRPKGTAK